MRQEERGREGVTREADREKLARRINIEANGILE